MAISIYVFSPTASSVQLLNVVHTSNEDGKRRGFLTESVGYVTKARLQEERKRYYGVRADKLTSSSCVHTKHTQRTRVRVDHPAANGGGNPDQNSVASVRILCKGAGLSPSPRKIE